MRRATALCAAAVALSAAALVSPAQAAPYHLIRWSNGYCQVWDEFWPAPGWPTDYSIITGQLPTWDAAQETKARLLQERLCLS